ncbi:MAG: ATP-dependent Clp protease ATP-binding subunit [Patescibacteria group bacterium]
MEESQRKIKKDEEEIKMDIFHCPTCNGYGFSLGPAGHHVPCQACHGVDSMYGYIDKQVVYFGKKFTLETLKQDKLTKFINSLFNILLIIFGVAGLGFLAWQMVELVNSGQSATAVFNAASWKTAIFWLSLLTDCYIYYRIEHDLEKRKVIKRRLETDKGSHVGKILKWEKFHALEKKEKIDISEYYDFPTLQALDGTLQIAKSIKQQEVDSMHLLAGVLNTQEIFMFFKRLGVDFKAVQKKIGNALIRRNRGNFKELDFNYNSRKCLLIAYEQSYIGKRPKVSPIELMLAILKVDQDAQDIFYDLEVDEDKVKNVSAWLILREILMERYKTWSKAAGGKPKSFMNRTMTARPTATLDAISQDFTQMARSNAFFPLIGREKEVKEAFRVLKESTGNVMLVGPAGVGKSTIIQGVAELMTAEDVPKNLQDKRLVVLDPGALIAGAEGIGTLEAKLMKIINEIMVAGNVVLAIEDIHKLMGTGSTGAAADLGGILMNFLSQGYLHVIGTTTTLEYQQYIQNVETFLRRFQVVKVDELGINDAIQVCEAKAFSYEAKNKVFISYDAVESAVKLTDRYIKDRHLPAKALDVLEESTILTHEEKGDGAIVTKQEVAEVLSEKTNVQVSSVTESEADKLLHLEDEMHKRVVGQDEAVSAIANALRRAREELRDQKRPIASFLFLGPTGVGKTETAKTIAEVYFGNEENMIRIDMSEYMERSSMSKLIGQPGMPGLLTEAVRAKSFSIVLLDEFEKAHPDVLNLFLQVMEDGRLTDGQGRTIDFTNTIVVATSNAGTQEIQDKISQGFTLEQIKNELMSGALGSIFKPELLNRFDNVVLFKPLTQEEILEIAQMVIIKLAEKMLQKGITLRVTEDALVELAQMGYDPKFGARPLRRVVQDTVDSALAKLLLGKKIGRRDIVILDKGGEMHVESPEKF